MILPLRSRRGSALFFPRPTPFGVPGPPARCAPPPPLLSWRGGMSLLASSSAACSSTPRNSFICDFSSGLFSSISMYFWSCWSNFITRSEYLLPRSLDSFKLPANLPENTSGSAGADCCAGGVLAGSATASVAGRFACKTLLGGGIAPFSTGFFAFGSPCAASFPAGAVDTHADAPRSKVPGTNGAALVAAALSAGLGLVGFAGLGFGLASAFCS